MVESKVKRVSYFVAFVTPCIILYLVFFIFPFLRGIGISFTNWDGLTPKTPISLEKNEFESKILFNKNLSQKDRNFIQEIYTLNDDNEYHRESINGFTKYKLESLIRKTDYVAEKNKFVGLDNYKKIFTGNVSKDFYPSRTDVYKFNKSSDLPVDIEQEDFEKNILKHAKNDSEALKLLNEAYVLKTKRKSDSKREYYEYSLTDNYKKSVMRNTLYNLPEVKEQNLLSKNDVRAFLTSLENASMEYDSIKIEQLSASFCSDFALSEESQKVVLNVSDSIYKIAELKELLSDIYRVTNYNMGVIGFTLFFAVFSVIGINVLAFLLALALDTGIKGQKILRTVFFLPNVLSMVIVALIWSMLFSQLLPKITGVEKWITDAAKTPWLLVLVATWQGAGYYMIVYLAGLQNIPTDVIEAGKIDGATGFQRFRYITLPMMLPSVTISLFLTIANALKSFDLIYAMIGQTGYSTGTVPFVMDIYFNAFSLKQAGLANAKAMLLFLVIVIITGIQLVVMKRKEVDA